MIPQPNYLDNALWQNVIRDSVFCIKRGGVRVSVIRQNSLGSLSVRTQAKDGGEKGIAHFEDKEYAHGLAVVFNAHGEHVQKYQNENGDFKPASGIRKRFLGGETKDKRPSGYMGCLVFNDSGCESSGVEGL